MEEPRFLDLVDDNELEDYLELALLSRDAEVAFALELAASAAA